MHRSKQHLYSITSPADYGPRSILNRPSLGGTLLPCVPQRQPISRWGIRLPASPPAARAQ